MNSPEGQGFHILRHSNFVYFLGFSFGFRFSHSVPKFSIATLQAKNLNKSIFLESTFYENWEIDSSLTYWWYTTKSRAKLRCLTLYLSIPLLSFSSYLSPSFSFSSLSLGLFLSFSPSLYPYRLFDFGCFLAVLGHLHQDCCKPSRSLV